MRRLCWCAWMMLPFAALAAEPAKAPPVCPSAEEKPDALALMERTEKLLSGSSLVATMTMEIKTPSWSRKLKMKAWTRGKDYALIRILEGGPREVGMMTLKREGQLWNYLPQAGRVMKLPSGMMGHSWLGSDLNNDDLVHGSSIAADYSSNVDGTVDQAGRKAWHVVLAPKPDAKVVWGKVEVLVDRETCVPLLQRFFDEDGKPARTIALGDVKKIGWRSFPTRLTVTPAETGRETTLVYDDAAFDVAIPDDTFSLHRLQQGR